MYGVMFEIAFMANRALGARREEHINTSGLYIAVGEHRANKGHNATAKDATLFPRENNFCNC